jgi:nucleoside-diphosphate-sugar epimerase
MRRVLVTGGTGLVGRALLRRMTQERRGAIRAAVRDAGTNLPSGVEPTPGELDADANWQAAVSGVDAIIHLAARVHIMREAVDNPLAEFRRVNVGGTLNLAQQAADAGVPRFIFVSSVKVNGESGMCTETDTPAPVDPYGISKHEAEIGLRRIAAASGMSVVIVRPPLVYGPGVGANFGALIRAVKRGMPLPLGAVCNRRSLIAVDNLVDFLLISLTHERAANDTFLVSDGEDLSTPELIRRLARAMDRPARLLPVPPPLLVTAATLTGRGDVARRLLDSLQLDITKARTQLAWVPPVSVDEGLSRAVASLT